MERRKIQDYFGFLEGNGQAEGNSNLVKGGLVAAVNARGDC